MTSWNPAATPPSPLTCVLVARDSGMRHGHVDFRSAHHDPLKPRVPWRKVSRDAITDSGEAPFAWLPLSEVSDLPWQDAGRVKPAYETPVLISRPSGYVTRPEEFMSAMLRRSQMGGPDRWVTLQGDNLGDSGEQPEQWVAYDALPALDLEVA